MKNQYIKEQNPTTNMDGNLLTTDEYQQEIANKISVEVFQTEENAEKTTGVISSFVQSYEQHKNEQSLDEWLISEFKKYPSIWQNEEEINSTAVDVISTVTLLNQTKTELYSHLEKGKSTESFLAKKIEAGAAASSVAHVGTYANEIDKVLAQSNAKNWDAITRKDGLISQSINLDGFIAEHHHVNTFNIDAAAKGSAYRAKVLEPLPGETYGKNSMDIGIYDENNKLVRRYQSKYGADPDATEGLFRKGDNDYRGQRKLVPEGHGTENSTENIEIDGVSSKPLSKEAAKELQKKAQLEFEAKQFEWNEVSRIAITKQIGKQALMGACITAGMHGSRILARRAWNSLTGKINPSESEDLKEFFESSISSATQVGVQVAVSGGLVVAVKNGWLGQFIKNTPAGRIANIAYIGLENAKVLYKFCKGELSKEEALDTMGLTTTTSIAAIALAVKGAGFGAALGTVFGPVGVVIGGFAGGVVGGMAGSSIGQAAYEGGKVLAKAGYNMAKSIVTSVSDGLKAVGSSISNFLFG